MYIGLTSSTKSWTPQHERKRKMEKEKSDAALARGFDDPSIPFFSVGSTNASWAGASCVEHSSGVFRHEAPVKVRVFLHEFLFYERLKNVRCEYDRLNG